MLQQKEPEDFVIATGKQHSVREFLIWAASDLGMTLEFQGSGADEIAIAAEVDRTLAPSVKPGDVIMRIDPRYFRPAEVDALLGDPSKAKCKLGWEPTITARQMCREMIQADFTAARRYALLKQHGLDLPVSVEA